MINVSAPGANVWASEVRKLGVWCTMHDIGWWCFSQLFVVFGKYGFREVVKITLLSLNLIVIRNMIRNELPCSLVVLLILLDWGREQGQCSLAVFPFVSLIIRASAWWWLEEREEDVCRLLGFDLGLVGGGSVCGYLACTRGVRIRLKNLSRI